MAELLQANWWLLVIAVLIGILVAWWILVASRKTTVEREEKPDEDGTAKRNQALIDATPAIGAAPPISPPPMTAVPEAAKIVEEEPEAEPASAPIAEPIAKPVPEPAPASPAPLSENAADDLTRIKGVGPKLVTILREQGVTTFAQVAAWDDATIDRIDAGLGRFQGRIRRDNWVEQAKLLSADDIAGYEDRFGKI